MGRNYLEESKLYKGYLYTELSNDELKYLHETTLLMFEKVIAILDKYSIRYTIIGGTLLGAVTQKGFIAWDDDIDICVFEEDYNRMQKVLIKELPGWINIQCKETEANYFHDWIKIRDKRSEVSPKINKYRYNGVWIDIYKIEKQKAKRVQYDNIKEHISYLCRRFKVHDISFKEFIGRCTKRNLIPKLIKELIILLKSSDNTEVYQIHNASRMVLQKDWIYPLKKYKFENIEVWGINQAESYLISHYGGSYNANPPEEMRRISINKVKWKRSAL